MSAPCQNACSPWITPERLLGSPRGSGLGAQTAGTMIAAATDILFELTGRRFPGYCTSTVRPFVDCDGDRYRADLGLFPIVRVEEVRVEGEVISGGYRIENFRDLVRHTEDGSNPGWPCSGVSRLSYAEGMVGVPETRVTPIDDDPAGIEVDVTYGVMPPPMGEIACEVLATEMAIAYEKGADECRLPRRLSSITRQGVTAAILDPFEFLEQGKVGIFEVDLFIRTYNPGGARRPAAIVSPDIGPSREVTG